MATPQNAWSIITDSSCDLFPDQLQEEDISLSSVPFTIQVADRCFVDDEEIDLLEMLDAMESCPEASTTGCPAPHAWISSLEKAQKNILITISSHLSGSMNSALTAQKMALESHAEKLIGVIDSKSTGPALILCIEHIIALVKEGAHFEKVIEETQRRMNETNTVFALCSFDNLVKNGRMNKIAGYFGKKLNLWGIGIGDDGKIVFQGITRGNNKALEKMIEIMRSNNFKGGRVIISHCQNRKCAEKMRAKILEHWENSQVSIYPTRGLCSFYAERHGLIVSY